MYQVKPRRNIWYIPWYINTPNTISALIKEHINTQKKNTVWNPKNLPLAL